MFLLIFYIIRNLIYIHVFFNFYIIINKYKKKCFIPLNKLGFDQASHNLKKIPWSRTKWRPVSLVGAKLNRVCIISRFDLNLQECLLNPVSLFFRVEKISLNGGHVCFNRRFISAEPTIAWQFVDSRYCDNLCILKL